MLAVKGLHKKALWLSKENTEGPQGGKHCIPQEMQWWLATTVSKCQKLRVSQSAGTEDTSLCSNLLRSSTGIQDLC